MSESLTADLIHVGKFGNSEADRPLAFGFAVSADGRKLELPGLGVRVRNARTESPYLTLKRAGERLIVAVDPDDKCLALVLRAVIS